MLLQLLTFNQLVALGGLFLASLTMTGTILGVYIKSRQQWTALKITQARIQIDLKKMGTDSDTKIELTEKRLQMGMDRMERDVDEKIETHIKPCTGRFESIERTQARDRDDVTNLVKTNREDHLNMFSQMNEIKNLVTAPRTTPFDATSQMKELKDLIMKELKDLIITKS